MGGYDSRSRLSMVRSTSSALLWTLRRFLVLAEPRPDGTSIISNDESTPACAGPSTVSSSTSNSRSAPSISLTSSKVDSITALPTSGDPRPDPDASPNSEFSGNPGELSTDTEPLDFRCMCHAAACTMMGPFDLDLDRARDWDRGRRGLLVVSKGGGPGRGGESVRSMGVLLLLGLGVGVRLSGMGYKEACLGIGKRH